MSTALPSFVELMASLGLEQKTTTPDSTEPAPSSPPQEPKERSLPSPVKAKSSPSLREAASRQRGARFSPYSSANSSSNRRGSVSSTSSYSSSSSRGSSPVQETTAGSRARRPRNPLCLNIYGSSTDLPANMPISTYVRRKTPATTPTSPTFPQESGSDPAADIPKTLTIPVLPSLLPNSASSESFPVTPNDADTAFPERPSPPMPQRRLKPPPDFLSEHGRNSNSMRYFTGVRISTSSRHSLNEQYIRRDSLVDIA